MYFTVVVGYKPTPLHFLNPLSFYLLTETMNEGEERGREKEKRTKWTPSNQTELENNPKKET